MSTAAAKAKKTKPEAPASAPATKPTTPSRWKEPSTYVGILAAVLSGFNVYHTAVAGQGINPADISGIAAGIYAVTNREGKSIAAMTAGATDAGEAE